jgi:hypothetical protein
MCKPKLDALSKQNGVPVVPLYTAPPPSAEDAKDAAREAYKAGYQRGHNDTVEGCYNFCCVEENECADEWLAEYHAARGEGK